MLYLNVLNLRIKIGASMANREHEIKLNQGVEVWNKWRKDNPGVMPDLSELELWGLDFDGVDFSHTIMSHTNLSGTTLQYANLQFAYLNYANLVETNFDFANLYKIDLSESQLDRASFFGANLNHAYLRRSILKHTNFTEADAYASDLSETSLIATNFENANISASRIYGISAWNVKTTNLTQSNLIITRQNEPEITVDNLEIAQFVYLLLNNTKLRGVIDTLTTKSVLILGRFTDERKAVLDAIRDELRKHDYVPILFDFDKPANRNFSETVMTLASLSRFVIVDLSDPNSAPYESLLFAERLRSVPLQGIFCPTPDHRKYFPMYNDLLSLRHVLPVYEYDTAHNLIASLAANVIRPAEEMVKTVRPNAGMNL